MPGLQQRRTEAQRAMVLDAWEILARRAIDHGLPSEKAITSLALGTDAVHAILIERGQHMSRSTVYRWIREIAEPVGQMPTRRVEIERD